MMSDAESDADVTGDIWRALRRRLALEWALVAVAATLLVSALTWGQVTESFDHLVYDQLSAYQRPMASDDVVIVAIDEESLAAYGRWPWSRDHHARLLTALAKVQPRAVAFDLLLGEPGPAPQDAELAQAMARIPGLILPLNFIIPGSNGAAVDPVLPLPKFAKAAAGIGHVNLLSDNDGTVRRMQPCFSGGDLRQWSHLMVVLNRAIGASDPPTLKATRCDQSLLFPFSRRGAFQEVSWFAVEAGRVPPALLRDKIILVGATANGLGDSYPVPMIGGGTMSGVEIMANMLGALGRDDFIRPLGTTTQAMLAILPLWVLLIGFWRWRPRSILLASLALIGVILAASALLLRSGIWFAPGPALAAIILVYPVWGWRRLQATSDYMDRELQRFEELPSDAVSVSHGKAFVDVVAAQAERLTAAIAHIRSLRREREEVLQLLSHDMRAPQAAILALLESSAQSATHQQIAGHARRTLLLADDFVGLARLKSNQVERQELLIGEIVREARDSLWPLAKLRAITLDVKVESAAEEAFILGEPSSLFRAFANLIDNAIKYSPEGGSVTITVTADRPDMASVKIADQGQGLSDAARAVLFERFGHDTAGAAGAVRGSGLGLYFVASVVAAHGGSVTGENMAAGGARFEVILPRLANN
ncbi:MAG: CHASE2 domain-containing protein [Parasphingorhabdus sp.]|nr:CHASE2 domain-containing protein [Parasphingorhabdus sp.]